MGKPLKRVNPQITCFVNRNFRKLYLREAARVIELLPDPWETSNRGRPPYDPKLVVLMCMYKEAFKHTYDSLEDETRDNQQIKETLDVDQVPPRSVVHRGMQKLSRRWEKRFNRKVLARLKRKFLVVIVDSTGFRMKTSSSWYDIRIKRKNLRKDNTKLHIVVCAKTGVILDWTSTPSRRHDSPKLKTLLRTLKEIEKVIGDSAYLSRKNCNLVVSKNGKPIFNLKKNTKGRAKGSPAFKRLVRFAKEHKSLFDKIYHVRSFVESVMSSIKKRYGSSLTAVKCRTRNRQLDLRVIAYNMKQVLYWLTARKLRVPYWVNC